MSDFDAAVFVKLPFIERIALCRRMADLTVEQSRAANPGYRENYLDLAKQWLELAEEMERAQSLEAHWHEQREGRGRALKARP